MVENDALEVSVDSISRDKVVQALQEMKKLNDHHMYN